MRIRSIRNYEYDSILRHFFEYSLLISAQDNAQSQYLHGYRSGTLFTKKKKNKVNLRRTIMLYQMSKFVELFLTILLWNGQSVVLYHLMRSFQSFVQESVRHFQRLFLNSSLAVTTTNLIEFIIILSYITIYKIDIPMLNEPR